MRKLLLITLLILCIIGTLIISACTPEAAAPTAAKILKVGICADYSGVAAGWGIPMARAVELAAERINAAGDLKIGGDKYTIECVRGDNQFTSDGAKTAAEKLVSRDNVNVVLGGVSSHDTLGTQLVTTPNKIINCSTAWEKKVLKEEGQPTVPYAFKCMATPYETARGLLAYVTKAHPEVQKVAIVAPNLLSSAYGVDLHKKSLQLAGLELVFTENFEYGTKDFYPILTKALATKPDMIQLADSGSSDIGLILKQSREMGYKGLFIIDTPTASPDVFSISGIQAAEGLIAHDLPISLTKEYSDYMNDYDTKFGRSFTAVADWPCFLYCYLQAVEKVGNIDNTEKIVEALEKGTFRVFGLDMRFGGQDYYGRPRMLAQPLDVVEVIGGEVKAVGSISVKDQISSWPTD